MSNVSWLCWYGYRPPATRSPRRIQDWLPFPVDSSVPFVFLFLVHVLAPEVAGRLVTAGESDDLSLS